MRSAAATYSKSVEEYKLYATNGDGVPEMVHAGEGYNFHVTGLTHDEHGYPNMTPQMQDKLIRRLKDKIRKPKTKSACSNEENWMTLTWW